MPRRAPSGASASATTGAPVAGGAAAAAVGVLLVGMLTAGAWWAAAPASAHAVLLEASPSDGSELDAPPEQVVLLFNEEVAEPRVAVVGPDGRDVGDGAAVAEGDEVVQPLGDLDELGEYEIAYRVVSADGHVVADELAFTLDVAETEPPPTPAPAITPEPLPTPTAADAPELTDAAATDEAGVPWLLLGVAAALLAVAGLAGALLRRGGS